jgi:Spy/CpxP family protein refolding chaperone
MNTLIPRNEVSISAQDNSPVRRLVRAGMAAALAGIVSFAGISHAQESGAAAAPASTTAKTGTEHQKHHQHHRHFRHGPMDAAHAEKRIEHRINRMLASVNASAEQKTRVTAIAKAAFDDLRPLQEQSRANRAAQFKLLSQAKIDADGLEKLRQEKLKLDDQRSRVVNKAFIDAAVVLTPEQRAELAQHMQDRMKKRQDRSAQHDHKKDAMDHQRNHQSDHQPQQ